MIQFAVCDDDAALCASLSARLSNYMGDARPHHVTCFSSGAALLASPQSFDVIFLDIQMEQPDGMETARQLRQRDRNSLLIFVSILRECVFDAFAVEAFDYLVKPLTQERFQRTNGFSTKSGSRQTKAAAARQWQGQWGRRPCC